MFPYLWSYFGVRVSGGVINGPLDLMVLGEYNTYADLPAPTTAINNHLARVLTTTGVIGINRRVAGWYLCNGLTWEKYETDMEGIDALTSHEALYAHDQIALNTAARHSHANKTLLDTYTQTNADLADAVSKRHTQNTDTGTSSPTFHLEPANNGPRIKNAGGELQARNALDTLFANFRAGSIFYDGDAIGPLRDSFLEISRVGNLVSTAILWTSAAKTQKIREINVTRAGAMIVAVEVKDYDITGVLIKTYSGSITRSGGQIQTVTGAEV